MRKLLLFSFFMPLFSALNAQTNAWYVTGSGDTVRANIKTPKGKKSPAQLEFDQSGKNEGEKYLHPGEVKEVNLDGGKLVYKSVEVPRYMAHADKNIYEVIFKDSVIVDTIFLRLHYSGSPFSLYHYRDVIDHFYVYDGSRMIPLYISYRYMNLSERTHRDPAAFITVNQFRQTLSGIYPFGTNKKMMQMLEATELDTKSLTKLLINMNQNPPH